MDDGGFSIIDEDRWERTRDDVTWFLWEKASRSASVNKFKLSCKPITGRNNELGLKSAQEKEALDIDELGTKFEDKNSVEPSSIP